jgi:hypothetical protein
VKITLTLTDPEDQMVVDFDARDRRAFERAGYKALGLSGPLQAAVQTIPDTYMAWLCWHAAKRAGLTDLPFDDFDNRLLDFEPDEHDAEELLGDPTKPATSAG